MTYVRKTRLNSYSRIILICLPVLIILIITASVILKVNRNQALEVNKASTSQPLMKGEMVNIIRASRDIQIGEIADISKLELIAVPRELIPDNAVVAIEQLKNKRLSSALTKGEFLLQSHLVDSNAWYDDGDRLIEHTFQDGAMPATVEVGSVVDIKLFKQKAKDPVVVSKAVVVSKVDKTLSFYLNEEEQEYIKEANTEGLIFLVQYLDKAQPASLVTYRPGYDKAGATSDSRASVSFADTNMNKD